MDLATAQAKYALAEAAYEAALLGKSLTSDGRTVIMEDAAQYRAEMDNWARVVSNLQAAAAGARVGVKLARWS